MGDIKLFKRSPSGLIELPGQTAQVEKSLQILFENNLEVLLGVRFLATEFSTGPIHGGRIDTLGIDEDGSPVIIEFKRATNQNVINQGLFYLDWMMDHKKDIEWLVLEKLGPESAKNVDWSNPRLICVAGDFTKYDSHAVKQMRKNVELLRYQRHGEDLLLIELVHAPNFVIDKSQGISKSHQPTTSETSAVATDGDPYQSQRINYRISQASGATKDLFENVYQYLSGIGDDVQVSEKKFYVAFKRLKNFACVEVYPQSKTVVVFLKVSPSEIKLEEGFTRDVTEVGHYGTGDLQVTLRSSEDFEKAKLLFNASYDRS